MAVLQLEPILETALSVYHNKNCYALLLGSGVSQSADIPTGWEITLKLIQELAARHQNGIETEEEIVSWFKSKYGVTEEPNYSTVMETVGGTTESRKNIVKTFIEVNGDLPKPGLSHTIIAKLIKAGYFRIVITTNFDPLLEIALTQQEVQFEVISTVDQIKSCTPRAHQAVQIFKLHGDYKDARMRNIDQELQGGYDEDTKDLLKELFKDFGVIVVGWSAKWDESLASALNASESKRFQFYFCSRGTLTDEAKVIVKGKSGRVVPIQSSDEFFDKLQIDLLALERINAPHPISAQVASEKTKMFIAEDKHSIELRDLVMNAALAYKAQSDDYLINLNLKDTKSVQDFYRLCGDLIQKGVVCSRVLSNLGMYSKESHHDLIMECLPALAEENQTLKTYDQNIGKLAYFPSLIGLYSLGIPLYLQKRYKLLGQILNNSVKPNLPFRFIANVPNIMVFDQIHSLQPSRMLKAALEPVLAELQIRKGVIDQVFEDFEAFLSIAYLSGPNTFYMRTPNLDCGHFWHGEYMIKNRPLNDLQQRKERISNLSPMFASEILRYNGSYLAQVENLVNDFESHRVTCSSLSNKKS